LNSWFFDFLFGILGSGVFFFFFEEKKEKRVSEVSE
jgi:hypothetical protein